MADESESEDSEQSTGGDKETADIKAELGEIKIDVSGNGQKETEELFYRVWNRVLDDAEEMDDSLRERLHGL